MNKNLSLCLVSRDLPVMGVVPNRMAVWELYHQWLKDSWRCLQLYNCTHIYHACVYVGINIYVHTDTHTDTQNYN